VICVLGRLRQEDLEFEARVGYVVRDPVSKTKEKHNL
jgi:hypothetical protein